MLGGKVLLDGKDITGLSTKKVVEAGLNYVPEDRHLHGLFKIADVAVNTTSAFLPDKSMGKFLLNRKKEREVTQKYIDDFRIKVTGQSQLTGSLSGGNQQKIVIGRSLSTTPKVVILDEPTRGIDVGAKQEIYRIMRELADNGTSIIMVSSEMSELIGMSDRIIVMKEGRVVKELEPEEYSQETILSYAAL